MDSPTTVVDLLELTTQPLFPGNSLTRYWGKAYGLGDSTAGLVLSEYRVRTLRQPKGFARATDDKLALISGGYHYIQSDDGQEELYNFETEPKPEEDHNLVGATVAQERLKQLRRQLKAIHTPSHRAHY
jgi:hypothetical protein